MYVDSQVLRTLAKQTSAAGETVEDTALEAVMRDAADCVDGSTTQWAARIIGLDVEPRVDAVASNLSEMAIAVRGADCSYVVTDSALAADFNALWK